MAEHPPKSRRRRYLWIAGSLLVLFTIFGFFIAPLILKGQLEKRASALLGRKVTVQKVRVNPYTMAVTLEGFDIRLQDGSGSFLGWDRLYVNGDPLASITGTLTVGAIELEGFHAAAEMKADRSFSFSDIMERLRSASGPSSGPAQPLPQIRVRSLKVQGARVDFVDHQPRNPFHTTFGPVSFALTEFVTAGSAGAPYHLEAVSEAGEKFTWTGTLAADPLESHGEFEIAGVILKKYRPYLEDHVQADIVAGRLSVKGRYEALYAGGLKTLKLTRGDFHLSELKITARADSPAVVELPGVDVTGITADAVAMKATVERVSLVGGHALVRREKDGSINLLTMLMPPNPALASAAAPAPLPDFMIGELSLQDFKVDVTDLAAPRPAQLGLRGLQLTLKNITLADGAEIPLQVALDWAPQGTVKAEGKVSIKPVFKADLKTDVAGLGILPLSPYLEQFINARITQGAVSSSGTVQVAMAGDVPAISFAGNATVEKFGLVDGARNDELAGFTALTLTDLKATTAPQLTVSLAEVNLVAPYARVIMNADKTLNLAALAKVPGVGVRGDLRPEGNAVAEPSGPKAPPAAESALPKIEIGKVVIAEGDFSLDDRSIEPNVRTAITRFGGTISGLSSENLTRADVDLKGTVDGAGPIVITGKLDPFAANRFVDLKLDFKGVDLVPFGSYSGKYAGYGLARGKLYLDIKATLDGKKLDATNVITLNQFAFGAPVESPDATKLPVRLGVALLKDIDGKIVIDVPVSGNIDDPSFRVGKVVIRVIINLLTKAAVSPFALLGSMFGGGGDELAYQEFMPGHSELQPAEIKKLETMVKALVNRPGLTLALEGGYDGPADTYALKQGKFAAAVRARIWEERHALDPAIAPPDQLEITPEASAVMVGKMFAEKFPAGTEFGALAQAPVAAAAPPAPKKGFFGRVVDVVTFKRKPAPATKPAESGAAGDAAAASAATGRPLAEMTSRLAETMAVTDNDLRALGAARAQRVRDYFINEGSIPSDRLFLTQSATTQNENKGPRVFLSLQ